MQRLALQMLALGWPPCEPGSVNLGLVSYDTIAFFCTSGRCRCSRRGSNPWQHPAASDSRVHQWQQPTGSFFAPDRVPCHQWQPQKQPLLAVEPGQGSIHVRHQRHPAANKAVCCSHHRRAAGCIVLYGGELLLPHRSIWDSISIGSCTISVSILTIRMPLMMVPQLRNPCTF